MKTFDKKSVALLIALTIALAEAFAVLSLVFVQYGDLQARYRDLKERVSQLESNAAAKVFATASPSIATVRALRVDGSTSQGTGFLVDANGTLVASYHVVANASSIIILYWDKTASNAKLIGGDIYTDIAVVRAERLPDGPPLNFRRSPAIGEPVYAIGSPYGFGGSLSVGVVSGVERLIQLADLGFPYPQAAYAVADVVQFDANVAPGSSGSPILNGKCEVVGVVFAMREPGIAFATSAHIAQRVVEGILKDGRYDHPWLGVGYQPDYIGGMKILYVFPGSPAERTGLREGDVITAVDGHMVRDACDFVTFIEKFRSPGEIVTLTVQRNGLQHQMQLQLAARL